MPQSYSSSHTNKCSTWLNCMGEAVALYWQNNPNFPAELLICSQFLFAYVSQNSFLCDFCGCVPFVECIFSLCRYYCRQGAKSGTPNQGADADECPAGYFCPVQTTEPQKCPQGTYSNATKLTAVTECTNCTAGQQKTLNFKKSQCYCTDIY